jgi:hypothetical protein
MKKDWVVSISGEVGYVTLYNFMQDYSLVQFKDMPMASMRRKDTLTPLDSAVSDVLTAVNESLPVTNTN